MVDANIKEDVVVDAANTLPDKGGRGGDNNNNNYGGKGVIWTMLLAWWLYCTFPRKRMGGG